MRWPRNTYHTLVAVVSICYFSDLHFRITFVRRQMCAVNNKDNVYPKILRLSLWIAQIFARVAACRVGLDATHIALARSGQLDWLRSSLVVRRLSLVARQQVSFVCASAARLYCCCCCYCSGKRQERHACALGASSLQACGARRFECALAAAAAARATRLFADRSLMSHSRVVVRYLSNLCCSCVTCVRRRF